MAQVSNLQIRSRQVENLRHAYNPNPAMPDYYDMPLTSEIYKENAVVGPTTRDALRRYQRSVGLPPDGYPTVELLLRLQRQ